MMKGMKGAGGKGSKHSIRQQPLRTMIPQKKPAGLTKDAKNALLRNDGGQAQR